MNVKSILIAWWPAPFSIAFAATIVAMLAATACSDDGTGPDPEPEPAPGPVTPEPEPAAVAPFVVETIALTEIQPINGRGLAVAVKANGDWAVAYAGDGTEIFECELFGGDVVERVTEVEVRVATPDGDGVRVDVVDTIPSAAQQSIDVAVDGNDNLVFAYAGGEPANGYCGPSDLVVAREANGTFTATTVQTDSATSTGCRNDENGPETICQTGDTVGHYASVAVNGDEVVVAFQDIHNGFAETDFSRGDLELARGNGSYVVESVSPGTGAGFHTSVAIGEAGRVVVASETEGNNSFVDDDGNPYSIGAGIWISVEQEDGSYAETLIAEGGLTTTRVAVGYHPVAGYVLAFHDSLQDRLLFARSPTGDVDSFAIAPVDQIGLTGRSPSIAFTDDGRVVIAYRYCAGPGASSCETANDGVRVALENNGSWRFQTLEGDDEDLEGLATDMAKGVGDTFVIASHNTSRDHVILHKLTLQ